MLDSKSDVKLTVDQLTLGKFKSTSVEDKFYDVPLNPLEGLPSSPNLKVPFSSKSLSFDEFSPILTSRRNASCPGLNSSVKWTALAHPSPKLNKTTSLPKPSGPL